MRMVPYLNFDGNCREAMTFYQRCLAAELQLNTFGETDPKTPPEAKDRVIHARLTRGDLTLMASDTMPGMPCTPGNDVWLSLACDSDTEVDALYAALGEGGKARMAPQDTFWGSRFAMVTDRFGKNWMFDHPRAPQR